jgi:single-strand DNA-binding protein
VRFKHLRAEGSNRQHLKMYSLQIFSKKQPTGRVKMARGSINKAIIIGTLGRDPEMRFLPKGNAVCTMSIATDEGYKDKNTGQVVEKTEWHRVEAFGRLAEIVCQYLNKGSKCYIEGKLRTDEYQKDGIKRYSTKIIANEMTLLDKKPVRDNNINDFRTSAHSATSVATYATGHTQINQPVKKENSFDSTFGNTDDSDYIPF